MGPSSHFVWTRLKDYNVYVTNVLNGESLDDIETKGKYALIVGNEGSGVRKNIQELATNTLYIPMNDKCESLNVAIATSIILYELNK